MLGLLSVIFSDFDGLNMLESFVPIVFVGIPKLLLFQYVDALILQVALLQFPLLTEIVGRTAGARVSKEKAAKGHENSPLMTPRWKLEDILYFHRPVWETVM